MSVLTAIVTVLAAALFAAAAWVKFVGEEHAMSTRDRLGVQPERYRMIGVCELAGAVGAVAGLGFRPLGIAALAGLVAVALGACAAQVRLRNPLAEARPAILALVLSVGALVLQLLTG
jgi:hypothetical protein